MIVWLALGGALLFAVVVLGFCAYELNWKLARVRSDVASLQALGARLETVRADLLAVQSRAASLGRR